jgi:ATP-dependent DNA helicase PIF1
LFPGIARSRRIQDLFTRISTPSLLQLAVTDYTAFRIISILTARNDTVTEINDPLLDAIPGNEQIYNSINTAEFATEGEGYGEMPAVEVLNSFYPASLPLSRLRLKIGAPIILLRNLAPQEGLYNGTRLSVIRLGRRCIYARILGGLFNGQDRLIPRIKLNSSDDELPYILSRVQFLVRLCFAITINKSQGQSFTTVGVDLRIPVFTYGQFYVAMSRATDVNRLTVLLPGDERSDRVRNIIYPEVLLL